MARQIIEPRYICILSMIITICSIVQSFPTNDVNELNHFEDDIILNQMQKRLIYNYNNITPISMAVRNGLINNSYRWPNKTILYRISSVFSSDQAGIILKAMEHIASKTCLRFQSTNEYHGYHGFLYITSNSNDGCNSAVGYQKRLQYLNIQRNPGCLRFGSIVHELLHTIGFYHEHSSAARDRYVRIRLENVQPGKEHNFMKYPPGVVSTYGVGYDYDSVMHYGSKAFTSNGHDTIQPLTKQSVKIGQRNGLSRKDIKKIKHMYNC